MARYTRAERDKLPGSAFAIPESREYPVRDHGHAMAALSDVSHDSPDKQRRVRAFVKKRFPSINVKGLPGHTYGADDNDGDEA